MAFNITGFLCYSIFNVGLFWVPAIQQEYFLNHPDGVIPVKANDVFFALHAVVLTAVTIAQSFYYESGTITHKIKKTFIFSSYILIFFFNLH